MCDKPASHFDVVRRGRIHEPCHTGSKVQKDLPVIFSRDGTQEKALCLDLRPEQVLSLHSFLTRVSILIIKGENPRDV